MASSALPETPAREPWPYLVVLSILVVVTLVGGGVVGSLALYYAMPWWLAWCLAGGVGALIGWLASLHHTPKE